jgi:hypothetical protein
MTAASIRCTFAPGAPRLVPPSPPQRRVARVATVPGRTWMREGARGGRLPGQHGPPRPQARLRTRRSRRSKTPPRQAGRASTPLPTRRRLGAFGVVVAQTSNGFVARTRGHVGARVAPQRSWEIPREVGNGGGYRETVTGPARSSICSTRSVGSLGSLRVRGKGRSRGYGISRHGRQRWRRPVAPDR